MMELGKEHMMGKVELSGRTKKPAQSQTRNEEHFKTVLKTVRQERELRERNRVKNFLTFKSA
ncbi:hypothetical protein AOC05_05105 [Arthrobacter alpinus]|uniref:Uncharacterized protein n=1 Tax=Arthrobacter alpinus TaxID=656366 RepID=A0A0M4RNI6_9MICC|nr:hypothetical protein AOC05_05105 [Arthrobacter alpinus]